MPENKPAQMPFSQLTDQAKQAARDAWKRQNPSNPQKTDAEIDQELSRSGQTYPAEGSTTKQP